MRIINPLYDQAFKYLMDNELIAKKVLSVILEKEVISVQSKTTEQTLIDKRREIPLSRFDFKAIIRTPEKGEQNVLIEIQKSKNPDPVMRFRRYLGKNYIRTETFIDRYGQEQKLALPIITIYILGYKLPEYDTPGILVANTVVDATTKEIIPIKNDFVELLTHPSYILQIQRLKKERRTKLEKFLAFFDQAQRTDDSFILDIDEHSLDSDFQDIADHLNRASQDEDMIDKLLAEEDIENAFDKLEHDLENAQKREEEERRLKEEERRQKEEERRQKQNLATDLAKLLKTMSVPTSEIEKRTGLTSETIDKL